MPAPWWQKSLVYYTSSVLSKTSVHVQCRDSILSWHALQVITCEICTSFAVIAGRNVVALSNQKVTFLGSTISKRQYCTGCETILDDLSDLGGPFEHNGADVLIGIQSCGALMGHDNSHIPSRVSHLGLTQTWALYWSGIAAIAANAKAERTILMAQV